MIAYVLFASTTGLQMTVGGRWRQQLGRVLATASVNGGRSPELATVGRALSGPVAYWWTAVGTVMIVFDMIAKPFS